MNKSIDRQTDKDSDAEKRREIYTLYICKVNIYKRGQQLPISTNKQPTYTP